MDTLTNTKKNRTSHCKFACCKHDRDPNEPNCLPGIIPGKTVFERERIIEPVNFTMVQSKNKVRSKRNTY